jgi:hypothetical protein
MAAKNEPTSLTLEECRELAAYLFEDAAALPPGPKMKYRSWRTTLKSLPK